MLEYEKKAMITPDEYTTIRILMQKSAPVVTQTNYYFDTDSYLMNDKGVTYRIRAKDGVYKATIKRHNQDNPDVSYEEDLIEKTEFDPKIFNVFGLHCRGELVTERAVIYKDDFCKMVIDRNTYLGHRDFELEIEYSEGNEEKATALLQRAADLLVSVSLLTEPDELLTRVGQCKSKSQRFFDLLRKIK